MVGALLASVLHRDLTPEEDGALGWAVTQLATAAHAQPTLADLAGLLADPGPEIAGRVRVSASELASNLRPTVFALGKLLDGSLRGMFDARTNVHLDWSGPGDVMDLSAVHHDPGDLTPALLPPTGGLQPGLENRS